MSETDMNQGAVAEASGVPPDLDELSANGQSLDPASLSVVFDLDMDVSVVLGRATMLVQEVLTLGRGSVVQLDRQVGEPIEVYVGNRRFAEGEVVVLDDTFGVRITRILGHSGNGSSV